MSSHGTDQPMSHEVMQVLSGTGLPGDFGARTHIRREEWEWTDTQPVFPILVEVALKGTGLPDGSSVETSMEDPVSSLPADSPEDMVPETSEIIRTLGETGLPGETIVEEMTGTDEAALEEFVFFPPGRTRTHRYSPSVGIARARERIQAPTYGGKIDYTGALDILDATDDAPQADQLHDSWLFEEINQQARNGTSAQDIIVFLDRRPCRTVDQQKVINEYHDTMVRVAAQDRIRQYGFDAARSYLDRKPHLRTPTGQTEVDAFYDQIIIDEARSKARQFGSRSAISHLDRHACRTSSGAAEAARLRNDYLLNT